MTHLQLNPLPTDDAGAQAPAPVAADPVTTIVAGMLAANAPTSDLVAVYLKLRDKKTDLANKAKAMQAPINAGMEKIEDTLLFRMQQDGVESVKTAAGTPYISRRVSVTAADADIFWRWVMAQAFNDLPLQPDVRDKIIDRVLDSGALAFVEPRPAKATAQAYAESHEGEYPPGLNVNTERVVNVRTN